MSDTVNRQSKGQPTGGQFAAKVSAPDDLESLSAAQSDKPNGFYVTCTYSGVEVYATISTVGTQMRLGFTDTPPARPFTERQANKFARMARTMDGVDDVQIVPAPSN